MHIANDIEKEVKKDVKTATKIQRLPWWGVLCLAVGSVPIFWLFDNFGRLDVALPVLNGIAVLGVAIAVKWKQRRRAWFWITMAVIVVLHGLAILYIPWTTRWVPATEIAGIFSIDLFVVFVILAIVEHFLERRKRLLSDKRTLQSPE